MSKEKCHRTMYMSVMSVSEQSLFLIMEASKEHVESGIVAEKLDVMDEPKKKDKNAKNESEFVKYSNIKTLRVDENDISYFRMLFYIPSQTALILLGKNLTQPKPAHLLITFL